jgi:hypothetical protein
MLPGTITTSISSAFTGFVLGRIRCDDINARILVNEISAMGIALKAGLVSPEAAVSHLVEIGAGNLLEWRSSQ